MKKRILFFIPNLSGGGSERVFLHLMNNLDRDRFEIFLAVLQYEGTYFIEINSDISVINLNTTLKKSLFKIARCIDDIRPDVILSTICFLNIMVGFARCFTNYKGAKFIARESGVPSQRKIVYKNIVNWDIFYRLSYRLFDKLICQSQNMCCDVANVYRVPKSKMVIINNPIDIDSLIINGNEASAEWKVQDKINLLFVGRLHAEKGCDLLLNAIALVHSKNIHLHILGEGKDRGTLMEQASALGVEGKVTFHGFQKNPYSFMATADVLVLSSRYEGFPNVLIEAMALGCPVVAFDAPGGINEIVRPGENGFLVPAENVVALAETIDRGEYLTINKKNISNSVLSRFRLSTILGQYEDLFLF